MTCVKHFKQKTTIETESHQNIDAALFIDHKYK